MKIFLAWSGDASHKVAETLHSWLPDVIQSAEPFMSDESIRKGQRWFGEINKELESTSFAILCLTPTNLSSPWIHFEAGACGKNVNKSNVTAILLDVTPSDLLTLPIAQFQHTFPTKEDMLKLLLSIDEKLAEKRLGKERVERTFARCWPDAEKGFTEARSLLSKEGRGREEKRPDQTQVLTSLLEVQVGIMKRMDNIETKLAAVAYVPKIPPGGGLFGSADGQLFRVSSAGLGLVNSSSVTPGNSLLDMFGSPPTLRLADPAPKRAETSASPETSGKESGKE